VSTLKGQVYKFVGTAWIKIAEGAYDLGIGYNGSLWTLNAYGQAYEILKDPSTLENPEAICEAGVHYRGF
jgi:hypothetical protein